MSELLRRLSARLQTRAAGQALGVMLAFREWHPKKGSEWALNASDPQTGAQQPSSALELRTGIALPQRNAPRIDVEMTRLAADARTLGFDSIWAAETPRARLLEPLMGLANAAAVRNGLAVGTAMVLPADRDPNLLAQQFAVLDRLAGGRLVVGVALGNARSQTTPPSESGTRLERFSRTVRVLRSTLDRADVRFPNPLTSHGTGGPPLWLGAHARPALARAASLADGWLGAGVSSTRRFRQELHELRDLLDHYGRSHREFAVGKRVYLYVDSKERHARQHMQEWFGVAYGDASLAEHAGIAGTPERCAEKLHELRTIGASFLLLHSVDDQRRQAELLAKTLELTPHV